MNLKFSVESEKEVMVILLDGVSYCLEWSRNHDSYESETALLDAIKVTFLHVIASRRKFINSNVS